MQEKRTVPTVKSATSAVRDLTVAFDDLSESVRGAFSVQGYRDYLQTVKRFGKALADQLLTLQLSFGRMKVAIAQAFAPIVSVVVPYINQAIQAITRFAGTTAQVIAAVMAGITGNNALASSAETAAEAENTLKTAATGAGKAVRRSVMGFDELNRLNAPAGGGGGVEQITPGGITVSPQAQAIAERILAVIGKLRAFLAPVLEGLQKLLTVLGNHLRWLWENILTPMAAWILDTLAPVLSEFLAAAFSLVAAALGPVLEGVQALLTALQPIAAFIGDVIILLLNSWKQAFQELTGSLEGNGGSIASVFQTVGQVLAAVWKLMEPILWTILHVSTQVFQGMASVVSGVVSYVAGALGGLSEFFSGVFAKDWRSAWNGLADFLKNTVNSIIGFFNSMIAGIVSALNGVIKGANRISITIPSWVPGVGGRHFGVHLGTVSTPQIPYLAQGAVLPANRPFMAVLGDQRHGTNIEAPLDTIRQAVALELGSLAAGIEAMVTEQRLTRRAVAEIRVGDSVIGRAAQRYADGLLTITGGV